MMKEIYWRIFLKVKKKEKAETISNTITKLLNPCEIESLDIYWKDDSLFCLELKQDLDDKEPKDIVYHLLKIISVFSNSWTLELPTNFNSDDLDFSGISNEGIKISNVTWMSFMLQDKDDISILDIV